MIDCSETLYEASMGASRSKASFMVSCVHHCMIQPSESISCRLTSNVYLLRVSLKSVYCLFDVLLTNRMTQTDNARVCVVDDSQLQLSLILDQHPYNLTKL